MDSLCFSSSNWALKCERPASAKAPSPWEWVFIQSGEGGTEDREAIHYSVPPRCRLCQAWIWQKRPFCYIMSGPSRETGKLNPPALILPEIFLPMIALPGCFFTAPPPVWKSWAVFQSSPYPPLARYWRSCTWRLRRGGCSPEPRLWHMVPFISRDISQEMFSFTQSLSSVPICKLSGKLNLAALHPTGCLEQD